MKLSVRVRGEWFAVPCRDGKSTIQWLGEESLRRYLKLKQASALVKGRQEEIYEIRKTKGGAILDQDDKICNVLDDNDFVSVVLKTDRANPEIRPQEISYVPEQIPGKFGTLNEVLLVNGYNLVPDDLLCLGKGFYKIKLTKEAEDRVIRSRQLVDTVLKENKVAYGVNTGFGKFASKIISDENLVELQENLVRSHAAGVGHPLTPERTRMLLALRINVLAKGNSGISLETLQQLVEAFNGTYLYLVCTIHESTSLNINYNYFRYTCKLVLLLYGIRHH
ncbi:histidine ammonia-lyase-like [Tachypleus tridentatus]|uniref:histidine ammonia-lyase-like n=1 Tax=Tachypleus tridentatus TaxID=6853 RepID=UPI003FCEF352